MNKFISKSILASLLIGATTVALADTTYVTCYYGNKSWEWGLTKEGEYQKITGNWKKTPNTNIYQFHLIKDWTKKDLENVCRRTFEQKGISSKVTGIYAADSGVGSNYEIIYQNESTPNPNPPKQPTTKLTKLSGEWKNINKCRGECGGSQLSYTVGVEKGKEIGKSSTIGKALSSTLGLEAEAFGVGVTTEFTYESNSEQTESIMNSFTRSKSQTIQTNCNGSSELWQWVSIATILNGNKTEEIEAESSLIACAPSGKGPKGADRRNPAWTP